MRAMAREPITIYGDGRQVRDVLFVQDLLDAMEVAHERIDDIGGRAFNIGGGVEHTISLLELLRLIGDLEGERPTVHAGAWRIGDQRWYVSDTRGFRAATGWEPQVLPAEGVRRLHLWLRRGQHREQLRGTG
jgi:CDP-paratose 2-epimerase